MLPSYDHIITRISIQTTGLAFGGTGLNMNMNTSLFPTRSHLSQNLAITISVSFAVSVHTLIIVKKLNSLKHLVRTTVAELNN